MTLSIVIPVYNEAGSIKQIINAVKTCNSLGLKKEIIVVDDASSDGTGEVLEKIKGIKFFSHLQNAGKGAAIKTGFSHITGDIVLIQDADLEYSPQDYPKLLEPFLSRHADIVYGTRFRGSEARRVIYFTHHLANQILTFYSNCLTNLNISDMECGYKVFSKKVAAEITPKLTSKRFGIEPELTARIAKIPKISIYEVGVTYQGRTYEEGKKIGFWDGVKAIYEITYFNLFAK